MLIDNIHAHDDKTTTTSLKCTISFIEVFLAETRTISKSRFPAEIAPRTQKDITTNKPKENIKSMIIKGKDIGKPVTQVLMGQ